MKKNYYQLRSYMAIAATTLFIASCSKDSLVDSMNGDNSSFQSVDFSENGTNPDDAGLTAENAKVATNGYLYTESNDAGLNSIIMYTMGDDGSLTLQSTTNSGGAGAGIGLGSQGALELDANNEFLFAVNAGSNSISSFNVGADGSLMLVSTVSSGGEMPVSLTCWGDYLYVVNFGSSNINGYMIGADGSLSVIPGTNKPLSAENAEPAQIKFNPNGEVLYITEKRTNRITEYLVNDMGVANTMDWRHSKGVTPFGFDFARDLYMVVSNAEGGLPDASTVVSYLTNETGLVNDINGAIPNFQAAACWVSVTARGRYAYVTNTGSNTISSYYVNQMGELTLSQEIAANTELAPIDIAILGNFYVYTINSGSHTIGEYTRLSEGGLTFTGTESEVPTFATGLVGF